MRQSCWLNITMLTIEKEKCHDFDMDQIINQFTEAKMRKVTKMYYILLLLL